MKKNKLFKPINPFQTLVVCGAVIFVVLLLMLFSKNISSFKQELLNKQFDQISNQYAENIKNKLQNSLMIVSSVADSFTNTKDLLSDSSIDLLEKMQSNTDFYQMAIINNIGTMRSTKKTQATPIELQPYFADAIRGNRNASDIIHTELSNDDIVIVYAPIKAEGSYRANGVLYGIYETKTFSKLLYHEGLLTEAVAFVFQENGSYISLNDYNDNMATYQNIFDFLSFQMHDDNDENLQKLKNDVFSKRFGSFSYGADGLKRLASYRPLGFNNWYILTVIPESSVFYQTQKLNTNNFIIFFIFSAMLIMIVIITSYLSQKKRTFEFEYNELKHYISDAYKILSSVTNPQIFEYDIQTKTNQIFSSGNSLQAPTEVIQRVPEALLERGIITKETFPAIKECYNRIDAGEAQASCEIKIRTTNNSYCWNWLSMITVYNRQGKPFRAVGFLRNIDEEKIFEQRMTTYKSQSEHDLLTGMYNFETFRKIIPNVLEQYHDSLNALLLIQLSNFDEISKQMGINKSNEILISISKIISNNFRRTDLIARIDNANFSAFMINPMDLLQIRNKAEILCNELSTIRILNETFDISVNIGIATSPRAGLSFEELFSKSQEALETAKTEGENQYCVYE